MVETGTEACPEHDDAGSEYAVYTPPGYVHQPPPEGSTWSKTEMDRTTMSYRTRTSTVVDGVIQTIFTPWEPIPEDIRAMSRNIRTEITNTPN